MEEKRTFSVQAQRAAKASAGAKGLGSRGSLIRADREPRILYFFGRGISELRDCLSGAARAPATRIIQSAVDGGFKILGVPEDRTNFVANQYDRMAIWTC